MDWMKHALAVTVSLSLCGCSAQPTEVQGLAADDVEHFAPGTWEVVEQQESLATGSATEPTTHSVALSAEQAAAPVARTFGTFYRGIEDLSQIRFVDGRIEGHYAQAGVDDLPGQTVPVVGSYSPRHLDVMLDFTGHGMTIRQTIRARLIQPAA